MADLDEKGLAPCPFCGADADQRETVKSDPSGRDGIMHGYVECADCGARGPMAWADEDLIDDLIADDWNRRATPPVAVTGEVEKRLSDRFCACANTITSDPCIVCGKPKLASKEWCEQMAKLEGDADPTTGPALAAGQREPRVKALEWLKSDRPVKTYWAQDDRGDLYWINQSFGSDCYYFTTVRQSDGVTLYDGDDLGDAKAAAQEDHDRRILSHFEPAGPMGSNENG